MPWIRVCPVSSSVWTWKVGSSSARRASAAPSFSWSILVFGSIATAITRSGDSDRDRNHRLGELDPLQQDRRVGGGEGVAGAGLLEADPGADVSRVALLDLLA